MSKGHRPPRPGPATYPARPGAGRQGLLQPRSGLTYANEASPRPSPNPPTSRPTGGSNGGRPPTFDPEHYKWCNTWSAVATRYDKRDYIWRGTVDVASIRIWLRDPIP